jgi:hypothetical protein
MVTGVFMYLVSAKLEGRSRVIAPPKRGVFVNAIFESHDINSWGLVVKLSVVIDFACCGRSFICSCCAGLML